VKVHITADTITQAEEGATTIADHIDRTDALKLEAIAPRRRLG
jgi:hypothetical protein